AVGDVGILDQEIRAGKVDSVRVGQVPLVLDGDGIDGDVGIVLGDQVFVHGALDGDAVDQQVGDVLKIQHVAADGDGAVIIDDSSAADFDVFRGTVGGHEGRVGRTVLKGGATVHLEIHVVHQKEFGGHIRGGGG